jgi:hypothetical protein
MEGYWFRFLGDNFSSSVMLVNANKQLTLEGQHMTCLCRRRGDPFATSALEGGGWWVYRFTPGKETRYPLYSRLGGPRCQSGRVRKISPPPGFDPRTVQRVASRYTDWAIPATCTRSKSNPITGLDRPLGFQEVEAPRFLDSRHMKVVRLSALRTGRLYPPGNTPGTHFC